MTDLTPTNRITFNSPSTEEVLRLDKEGFHYRGEFIEDAGQAHRLLMTFLQRHTSMHPEVVEQEVNWRVLCLELTDQLADLVHRSIWTDGKEGTETLGGAMATLAYDTQCFELIKKARRALDQLDA